MTNTHNTHTTLPTMAELFNKIRQDIYSNDTLKRVLADEEVKLYANKLHKLVGSEEKARTYLNKMLIQGGKLKENEKVSAVKFKDLLDKKVRTRMGKSQTSKNKKDENDV